MLSRALLCGIFLVCWLALPGPAAQPQPRLEVTRAENALLFRAGPVRLSGTTIQRLGGPPPLQFTMPLSGWAVAFQLGVVDKAGRPIPGHPLRRVTLEYPARTDLLCPDRAERLFAAYDVPVTLPEFPGIGFAFEAGQTVRLSAELSAAPGQLHPEAYLELTLFYRERGRSPLPVVDILPLWLEVGGCGTSFRTTSLDLPPGTDVRRQEFVLPRHGKLLGAVALAGQYGQRLLLERLPGGIVVDFRRQNAAVPLVNWMPRGGTPVSAGERLRLAVEYSNATAVLQPGEARAAVLAYFLPAVEK